MPRVIYRAISSPKVVVLGRFFENHVCVVSCYLGVVGHTWAWFRIVSCGFAWFPLVSRSFAWFCMVSQGFTWFHVVSHSFAWSCVVSRGFVWFRVAFICPEKNYWQKSSKSYIWGNILFKLYLKFFSSDCCKFIHENS